MLRTDAPMKYQKYMNQDVASLTLLLHDGKVSEYSKAINANALEINALCEELPKLQKKSGLSATDKSNYQEKYERLKQCYREEARLFRDLRDIYTEAKNAYGVQGKVTEMEQMQKYVDLYESERVRLRSSYLKMAGRLQTASPKPVELTVNTQDSPRDREEHKTPKAETPKTGSPKGI